LLLLLLLLLLQELHLIIDSEFRYDHLLFLVHCTAITKLSSDWVLDICGRETLPPSLRVMQIGTVSDVDSLLDQTPQLRYLSMRQCSTEAEELCKLTALTSLQELHLEYGQGTENFIMKDSWQSADDDDSFINVSAAANAGASCQCCVSCSCVARIGKPMC
jgi:hypothetical protein